MAQLPAIAGGFVTFCYLMTLGIYRGAPIHFFGRVLPFGCSDFGPSPLSRCGLAKHTDLVRVDVRRRKRDICYQCNRLMMRSSKIEVKKVDHPATKCTQLAGMFVFALTPTLAANVFGDVPESVQEIGLGLCRGKLP
jgi:hypothetical protein